MNFQSIVAFLIAGFVLAAGVVSAGNLETFINEHAILIVLGGTFAAGAIAFQIDRIFLMFKIFLRRVIRGRQQDYKKLLEELMRLSEGYRTNAPGFERTVQAIQDPFLREAMEALLDEVLEPEELIHNLRTRMNTLYQRQTEDVVQFRAVGKYPPAFGLMGTTLSMISLLQKLGQPGGQKLIGPSMALGLVATFFGLALSNIIFNPISENLQASTRENKIKNLIIVEGIRLILQRTNPVKLAEELNAHLLPSERIEWKKAAAPGAAGKTKAA